MAETSADFGDEHLVIHLDANGPIELGELHRSLAALASIYERQYLPDSNDQPAPKLYVTRVSSGSIDLEIVPLLAILGMPLAAMDSALIIRQFAEWVGVNIRYFAEATVPKEPISPEDAADLKTFLSPMTGRKGAELNISHARFHKKEKCGTKEREITAEYNFKSDDINRAALNIEKQNNRFLSDDNKKSHIVEKEVLMVFQQADINPGKQSGRTGDRVIIEKINPKPLAVYFPAAAKSIKNTILEQTENPFTRGYIVDVSVQYVGKKPKLYSVTHLHEIIDLDLE